MKVLSVRSFVLWLSVGVLLSSCASLNSDKNSPLQTLAVPTRIEAINAIAGSGVTIGAIRAAHNSGTFYNWSQPVAVKNVPNLWLIVGRTTTGNIQFQVFLERTPAGKLAVDLKNVPRLLTLTSLLGGKSQYKGVALGGTKLKLFAGVLDAPVQTLSTLSSTQAIGKVSSASQGESRGGGTLSDIMNFKSGSVMQVAKGTNGVLELSSDKVLTPSGIIVTPCRRDSCNSERRQIVYRLAGVVGHGALLVTAGSGTIAECVGTAGVLCAPAAYSTYQEAKVYVHASSDYYGSLRAYDNCRSIPPCRD